MGFPAKSGSVRTGEWTAEEDEMRSQLADNFKQSFSAHRTNFNISWRIVPYSNRIVFDCFATKQCWVMQCIWDHPLFGNNPSECCNQGLIKRCYTATTWRAKNVPCELMRARKSQWEPRRPKLASECHRQSQLKPEGAKERIQVRQRASQREPERSREPERALVRELEPEEAREKERVRKSQREPKRTKERETPAKRKKFEINLSGSSMLPLAFFGSLQLPLALSANFWLTWALSGLWLTITL